MIAHSLEVGDIVEISEIVHRVMHDLYQLRPGDRGQIHLHNVYFQIDESTQDKHGFYMVHVKMRDGKTLPFGPVGKMPDDHKIIVWQNNTFTNLDVLFDLPDKPAKLRWYKTGNSPVIYK